MFVSFSRVKVDYNFIANVVVSLQSGCHLFIFFINVFFEETKLLKMLSSLFVSFSQVKVDYNFNAEVQVFLQSWYHLFFINDFY